MSESDVFIVTSTVATKYGTGDRLSETLGTIESIRKRSDAKIMLLDSSVTPWDEIPVRDAVDTFLRINDEYVRNLSESPHGRGFIKSATECYLMRVALDQIGYKYKRIYKLSGRYRLTDQFQEHSGVNVTTLLPIKSGLTGAGADHMLMTRLYSFDNDLRTFMANVYTQIERFLWDMYSNGYTTDIEHGMYKYLPKHVCSYKTPIGVTGRIGHLRVEVTE